jgi:hypothetical protein
MDPHWFDFLDPDLDPHCDKKLDSDPHWYVIIQISSMLGLYTLVAKR